MTLTKTTVMIKTRIIILNLTDSKSLKEQNLARYISVIKLSYLQQSTYQHHHKNRNIFYENGAFGVIQFQPSINAQMKAH